jgi:hypothetical protein
MGDGSAESTLESLVTASSVTGLMVPIDSSKPEKLDAAVSLLRLSNAEKAHIRGEVLAGRLHLGATTVSDWAAEDGDVVTIASAGFVQTVVIQNAPHIVVVPYSLPIGALTLTAVHDGGGGVTVAVGMPSSLRRLRTLLVGEVIQVGLQ